MPKINVYLSDELAAAVKRAGFPVSPVCQRALAEAVNSAVRARKVIDAIRDPVAPDQVAQLEQGICSQLTERLASVLEAARASQPPAGTGRLLLALLDEGGNLALTLLQALDIDLDELRSAVERRLTEVETPSQEPGASLATRPGTGTMPVWPELTWPARYAIAAALESSISFAHNYVGCEHLLIGLLDDPASQASGALGDLGVTAADARRALSSAVAGYTRGRQQATPSPADGLAELLTRLESVERRLADIGG